MGNAAQRTKRCFSAFLKSLALFHQTKFACLLFLVLGLGGCVGFSPDGGMDTVQSIASAELGKNVNRVRSDADAAETQARVRALIKTTLTPDSAVQIALLNNRGLQASFAELAAVEAESVESALPPSPTVSLSHLASPSAFEIEQQVLVNVLGLLTLPRRRELAEGRFRQAQLKAAEAVLRLAAETRRAYYRAIAASQLVKSLEEANASAEAASELAQKLGETGAINKLAQAREHAFYADLGGQLASARLRAASERETLTRLMGLWGEDIKFKLPSTLPALPAKPKTLRDIEAEAINRRIDLQIVRVELEVLAKSLGLTKATRMVNALEVAAIDKR